jgi:hypothetical protein
MTPTLGTSGWWSRAPREASAGREKPAVFIWQGLLPAARWMCSRDERPEAFLDRKWKLGAHSVRVKPLTCPTRTSHGVSGWTSDRVLLLQRGQGSSRPTDPDRARYPRPSRSAERAPCAYTILHRAYPGGSSHRKEKSPDRYGRSVDFTGFETGSCQAGQV